MRKATEQQASISAAHLSQDLDWLKIGSTFRCGENDWLVTDIGTRTLCAVKITDEVKQHESWLNGPPFAIPEFVFDEYDIEGIER